MDRHCEAYINCHCEAPKGAVAISTLFYAAAISTDDNTRSAGKNKPTTFYLTFYLRQHRMIQCGLQVANAVNFAALP